MAAAKVMPAPSRRFAPGPSLSRNAGEGLSPAPANTLSAANPLPRKRGRVRVGASRMRVARRHSVLGPKNRAAVDDRAPHPALRRASIKRRVLGFRAEIVGGDAPRQ